MFQQTLEKTIEIEVRRKTSLIGPHKDDDFWRGKGIDREKTKLITQAELDTFKKENKLEFFIPKKENGLGQWLAEEGISAGFPSPADDFKETRISLDRELVKNKEATFYARVSGDSMIGAGLDDGDLLVIDRSKNPENGKIAICLVDGEFTVKRIKKEKNRLYLMPENKKYKPIELKEENELIIWGVVEYVIKKV